jgi:prepilin-type N-terminal cleavage/methylation domain-containing protein/prepilin-type processing-associated H-X9-DG protein
VVKIGLRLAALRLREKARFLTSASTSWRTLSLALPGGCGRALPVLDNHAFGGHNCPTAKEEIVFYCQKWRPFAETSSSGASAAAFPNFPHRPLTGTRPLAPAGGFNLIELLVVIAIIAVLAAMLLPALSRSKAQALSTVCKNHEHELGIAVRMYVDDTKYYPLYNCWIPSTPDYPNHWYDALGPYYQLNWTNPAYHCPAYNGAVSSDHWMGAAYQYGSYSYNLSGTGRQTHPDVGLGVNYTPAQPSQGGYFPPHSEGQVVAPGETYAIMDTREVIPYGGFQQTVGSADVAWIWTGSGWTGYDYTGCPPLFESAIALATGPLPIQHDKSFNVLFCDGHVASVLVSNLFNLEISARNWNVDNQPRPELW